MSRLFLIVAGAGISSSSAWKGFADEPRNRDQLGIAGGGDDLAVLVRDGVDAMHGLDDPAAAHGYAHCLHGGINARNPGNGGVASRAERSRVGFPDHPRGPAHVATLKTFRPAAECPRGQALRRCRAPGGKRLLFPDRRLGRARFPPRAPDYGGATPPARCRRGRPEARASRLAFQDGSRSSSSPRADPRNGAGVLGCSRPSRRTTSSAHLGPDPLDLDAAALADIVHSSSPRLHSLLRAPPSPASAAPGRNEILHAAQVSPYALTTGALQTRRSTASPPRSGQSL